MNAVLINARGEYIGTVGTSTGILDMVKHGPPSLRLFIARGTADENLALRICKEIKESKDKEYRYLLRSFMSGYYPIRLVDSNTIGDAEIQNDITVQEKPSFYPDEDGSEDAALWAREIERVGHHKHL